MSVTGISQNQTTISKRTQIKIKALPNNFTFKVSALVIPRITQPIPQLSINASNLNIPSDLILADQEFLNSASIDLLLGAEIFYSLLKPSQIKLGKYKPILQDTKLGWAVSGPIPVSLFNLNLQPQTSNALTCTTSDNALQKCLELFWNSEETTEQLQINNNYSLEETECENHFQSTTRRDPAGRFILNLPLNSNVFILGDSLQTALKRFNSLEQKLAKNPEIKKSFSDFISEYISLGHMSEINPINDTHLSYPAYYLPHHCVEKSDSLTTRLRVVFDGSSASSSGFAINDCLKIGPTVQNDLFTILLRFREHNYVLTGDIAKMYWQFLIDPNQRCLQRILWRNEPQKPLLHYELNTITYGMSSSAFLATRCLRQISYDISESYPIESNIIKNDFDVDDGITGSSTEESLLNIRNNLVNIFKSYGLDLRKFYSNSKTILSDMDDPVNNVNKSLALDATHHHKTLGISWNPEQDNFIYNSTFKLNTNIVTKRVILSLISQIFDPLGLLGPMILQVKLLLQKLWLLKLGWDDPVPVDIFRIWKNFTYHLSLVEYFKIPRQVTIKNYTYLELHGFSDSSINAFGACVYVRTLDSLGNISVNLLSAKSRVAPLKAVSLPRLELCGALLLSRLMDKILKSLNCKPNKVYYYTDSTIVLCWLSQQPRQLKTYICNRVSEVQKTTDIDDWHHITSHRIKTLLI
ncbi:uncharacterized protein LOC126737624 [Anthonomus grandis grandis]|uniref:uncharacterized protein LOC126737624 n=1 Tax=Anthonomus grandis grandis TaxID=2921223 RepID=UPI0021653C2D|nr:uncharacterized protein LOC126737624 [Anthonomus grandis grandis]